VATFNDGDIGTNTMKRIALAFALLVTAPALVAGSAWAQGTTAPAGAMTPSPDDRAKQWLTLVDDANYSDGYKQMGSAYTAKISVDAWTQKMKDTREPLGAMSNRNIKDVKVAGSRATIRYDSAFAHKAVAVETVVLTSGKDGWSVTDYRID
jgi:hypothetical protein